jgi:putative hydrolase of the HAD superfamily
MSDLEPSEVESRRAARDRALELLYEAEAKGLSVEQVLTSLPVAPADLAVELVRGVAADTNRIDELVATRVAPRWSLARLASVDRAILRLGTYELLDRLDRPQAVVINEAVVLARRYGTDDSPRFVNGVLSAIAKAVRGDENVSPATGRPAHAAQELRPAEALVIDLDGVVRHWLPDALPAIDREFDLPPGTAASALFDPALLEEAMTGRITVDEWCARLGEAVAAQHPADAGALAKAFSETPFEVDREIVALVDEVRVEGSVALLSNASTRLLEDLQVAGLDEHFDAIVGSADLGATKPDPVVYRTAAERLGVAPEACLMVDDRAENVEGARAVGMQGFLYTGPDELRAALVATGLIPD